jgi:hypothetical protein
VQFASLFAERITYRSRMLVTRLAILSLVLSSTWSSVARGDDSDAASGTPIAARPSADDDVFTPGLTHAAAHGRGAAVGVVSYNGASDKTTLDFNGEVQVFGPLRLVLRVDNVTDKARPGIGAAVQFLDEAKHGAAASAYFTYKAEGFTEAEGELELLVSFGKQLGPARGTFNLAYGQDPEARERDGEVALGLHIELIRGLFAGVIGRYRDALGSDGDKGTGIVRDVLGGASATYVVGRFGLTAQAGFTGVETLTSGSMQTGTAVGFAAGAVF